MKAYVFPGQGSQKKGMGENLFGHFNDLTEKADSILGYSIKELCISDPHKKLNKTEYTQPALYVVNALMYLNLSILKIYTFYSCREGYFCKCFYFFCYFFSFIITFKISIMCWGWVISKICSNFFNHYNISKSLEFKYFVVNHAYIC